MGVNMPARTVMFSFKPGRCLKKWNGKAWRWLKAAEYAQMGGRAGRRGDADEGRVVTVFDSQVDKQRIVNIVAKCSEVEIVRSAFAPDVALLLRALRQGRGFLDLLLTQNLKQFQQRTISEALLSDGAELEDVWASLTRRGLVVDADRKLTSRGEALAHLDIGGDPLRAAALLEMDGLEAHAPAQIAALFSCVVNEPAYSGR